MSPQCLPSSFGSIRLTIREQMWFEDFQEGAVAAILDFGTERFWQFWISISHQRLPSFRLNPTYGLGGDVVWRISRWPAWRPSWISERNDLAFWISKSPLCHPPSFGLIRLTVRELVSFENFQESRGSYIGYRNGTILEILNPHVASMPPTKFGLNLTAFGSRCGLKIFKMAVTAAILDIGTERF